MGPRPVLVVVAALLAVVGTASSAQAHSQARTPAGTYRQQAVSATNAHRAHRGLTVLGSSRCLQHAANRQARVMATRETMFHQDLHGVLDGCHLNFAGENVAAGFVTGTSAVDDGWMESPGHRANLLDPSFSVMGIGAREGRDGRWYVSQVLGRPA